MYQLDSANLQNLRRMRIAGIGANVFFLGITSMLTDISSEMVASVLPIYFVFAMGLTPLQFGVLDGLSQGAAAIARVVSGVFADRWRRSRDVAALGYGLSALCRPLMLAAGSAWGIASVAIALDRIGKGIRTSPRDSLISLSADPKQLGMAFGIHRALDTAGALMGPLVAFAILALTAQAFDLVFVTSFFVAIAGFAALVCFVKDPGRATPAADAPRRPSAAAVFALMRNARIRGLVVAGSLLGLFTVADAFVFLLLQRKLSTQPAWFPLFYAVTSAIYLALAIPAGAIGDRIGRARMFLVGHALLVLAGIDLLASGSTAVGGFVALGLLGAYYACTDGVLMALASRYVPIELRASGLGIVASANGVARWLGSMMFGALWDLGSIEFALTVFTIALASTSVYAAIWFTRLDERP